MLINHNLIAISAAAAITTLMILRLIKLMYRFKIWPLHLICTIVILGISLYIPIYKNCTLVQLIRGIIGDLSITTLLILCWLLIQQIFMPTRGFNLNPSFAVVITLVGSLLYLSTLGFIDFDIYSFGYFPKGTILLTIGLLILFLLDYARGYAWVWLVAIISFYFQLQCSNNLWDYLFDPVLWLMAIIKFFRPDRI